MDIMTFLTSPAPSDNRDADEFSQSLQTMPTEEILNVIRSAGFEHDEEAVNQLATAIKQLSSIGSPTGMIAFIHATDVPDGWLLCNGVFRPVRRHARDACR